MKSILFVFISICVVYVLAYPGCPTTLDATITSQIDEDMLIDAYTLDHGKWVSTPDTSISAGSDGSFSCSDYCEGIEGTVSYKIDGSNYTFYATWDLPEVGSNEYSVYVRPVNASCPYKVSYSGGSGYSAQVLFIITYS